MESLKPTSQVWNPFPAHLNQLFLATLSSFLSLFFFWKTSVRHLGAWGEVGCRTVGCFLVEVSQKKIHRALSFRSEGWISRFNAPRTPGANFLQMQQAGKMSIESGFPSELCKRVKEKGMRLRKSLWFLFPRFVRVLRFTSPFQVLDRCRLRKSIGSRQKPLIDDHTGPRRRDPHQGRRFVITIRAAASEPI